MNPVAPRTRISVLGESDMVVDGGGRWSCCWARMLPGDDDMWSGKSFAGRRKSRDVPKQMRLPPVMVALFLATHLTI